MEADAERHIEGIIITRIGARLIVRKSDEPILVFEHGAEKTITEIPNTRKC